MKVENEAYVGEKRGSPGGTDWQRGISSNLVPSVQAALVAATKEMVWGARADLRSG